MSVDPQLIRSEPHTEIGSILIADVASVLERWSQRAVKEQPNAKRAHHSVLLDHLRDFLQTLGSSLAESEASQTSGHYRLAVIHGEQRWEAGWSLTEVMRDYQILRLVIFDYLEETLNRPIGYHEVLAIGLALDEAIAASVVAYVKERDEYLGQLEKKRADDAQQTHARLEEQANALRLADRRKNEFLAMLAHELRNPLAPIGNAIEIQRLIGPSEAELKWSREVIARQMQHMTRIVDDLLDVSRIGEGKVKLQVEPVDILAVVNQAVEMATPLIDSRKQQLTLALSPEPIWLNGDAVRLTQVLSNLLNNATKYTNEGGKIWLTVERQGDELIIKVRDSGVGISAELLPHVFEPFIQEDRSLDRSNGGLGLGLTLVRSLVELHGGEVTAKSDGRSCGSEFAVHLPALKAALPPTTESHQPSLAQKSGKRWRILVVDDNLDGATTLSLLLRCYGHDVCMAHDGPTALELTKTWTPDIVLLDIGLPGMDGLEVARRVRQKPHLKGIQLIAISGYGQDEDHRRSEEAGFNAHFIKPLDFGKLNSLLNELESAPEQ